MSEPDNPRWLGQVSGELRQEVPVRAAWRAKLLDEVAGAQKPSPGAGDVETPDACASDERRPRRLVLHPLTGLAAAVAFAAVGAGATLAVMSARADRSQRTDVVTSVQPSSASGVAPVSDAAP